MWSKVRLTGYIGAAFAGLAFLGAVLGLGDYDPATGMFDLHAFNVYWLAGVVAGPVASGLAAIALALGWGKNDSVDSGN